MKIPYKNILRVAIIVAVILLIPLVMTIRDGAVEGAGWNWTPSDFAFMGSLLFITGLGIDFAARKITRPVHRILAIALIALAFLAVWTELAVGAVSQMLAFLLA